MRLVAVQNETIKQLLAEELDSIERRFSKELQSDLACVNELAKHVERYHGKRLRPLLMLVCGLASSPDTQTLNEAHRTLATVVEMIHLATLVHDDILDEAAVRRQGPTVNHLRGNEMAVMLGDYLISHAYHLCSTLDSQAPAKLVAKTTNIVCEGELLQLANRENWQLDEATYFDIIQRKTASLCGLCCRLAAIANQCESATVEHLTLFGENLGLSFQIIDDLLDLTGDQEVVGKTLGCDLQKGKLTLPLIHYIRSIKEPESFIALLKKAANAQGDLQYAKEIRKRLHDHGSVAYAIARAETLITQAMQSLEILDDSPARGLLMEMAQAVLTRES